MRLFDFLPRFSIRTLFALTTAVCLLCAALGWRISAARQQGLSVNRLHAIGAGVIYDYQFECKNPHPVEPAPNWAHSIFGVDLFQNVVAVEFWSRDLSADELQLCIGLRQINYLCCSACRIDDSGWREILRLKNLKSLCIAGDEFDSTRFRDLAKLPKLRYLVLSKMHLSTEEMRIIAELQELREVFTYEVDVELGAAQALEKMASLEELTLSPTTGLVFDGLQFAATIILDPNYDAMFTPIYSGVHVLLHADLPQSLSEPWPTFNNVALDQVYPLAYFSLMPIYKALVLQVELDRLQAARPQLTINQ